MQLDTVFNDRQRGGDYPLERSKVCIVQERTSKEKIKISFIRAKDCNVLRTVLASNQSQTTKCFVSGRAIGKSLAHRPQLWPKTSR